MDKDKLLIVGAVGILVVALYYYYIKRGGIGAIAGSVPYFPPVSLPGTSTQQQGGVTITVDSNDLPTITGSPSLALIGTLYPGVTP